jgi:hypothetical protein
MSSVFQPPAIPPAGGLLFLPHDRALPAAAPRALEGFQPVSRTDGHPACIHSSTVVSNHRKQRPPPTFAGAGITPESRNLQKHLRETFSKPATSFAVNILAISKPFLFRRAPYCAPRDGFRSTKKKEICLAEQLAEQLFSKKNAH